jgi:hypothetical protein
MHLRSLLTTKPQTFSGMARVWTTPQPVENLTGNDHARDD